MYFKIIIFSLLLVFNIFDGLSFTKLERRIMIDECVELLNNYFKSIGNYSNAQTEILMKKEEEKLFQLFSNSRIIVNNDFKINATLSNFIEVGEYLVKLKQIYPNGIVVKADMTNLKSTPVNVHGNGLYSIDFLINVQIEGKLQANTAIIANNLVFRIGFVQVENKMKQFKIAGIRNETIAFPKSTTYSVDELKSMKYSDENLKKIESFVKLLLKDYENYLNLIGNPDEANEEKQYFIKEFTALFLNPELRISNDLVQNPEKENLAVFDYIDQYYNLYNGKVRNLSLTYDSINVEYVVPLGKNRFYTRISVEKFFNAITAKGEIYRFRNPYDFIIVFDKEKNDFKNFRIEAIDSNNSLFFEENVKNQTNIVPEIPVTENRFKNISAGVGLKFSPNRFTNRLITNDPVLVFSADDHFFFAPTIEFNWKLSKYISIHTGFSYAQEKTIYTISGNYSSSISFKDLNELNYYRQLELSLDSQVVSQVLTFPALVRFQYIFPTKWGFYSDFGASLNYMLKYQSTTKGAISMTGNYPDVPELPQNVDFPELGFFRDRVIDKVEVPVNYSKTVFNIEFATGVVIPTSYYSRINIGFNFAYSMNQLLEIKEFTDYLGNNKRVNENRVFYGVDISYIYNF